MILIVSKKLVRFLSFGTARAMALYPFVLQSRRDMGKYILFHEKIHLRQQLEMLIIPFYIWYAMEFLIRLVQFKNRKLAYINISFEREAYQNHYNYNYLKSRKCFAFMKYC